jgi:GT2 family glycosyltransferase
MSSVSVITVTYNSGKDISNFLESALPEIKNLSGEIIIIDNNSRDDTTKILKKYSREYDFLKIIYNEANRGYSFANNQGITESKGKFLFFLNPDTIIVPGSIKQLISYLEKAKNTGAIAPQLRFPDGRIQKSCRKFPTRMDIIYESLGLNHLFPNSGKFNRWKMKDFGFNELTTVDQPAGAAFLVNSDLVKKLDGFDESLPMFFSDVDLCKRIWYAGKQIFFYPNVFVIHIGGSSVLRNRIKMMASSHVSFYKYLKKHNTLLSDKLINPVIGILLMITLLLRILFYPLSYLLTCQRETL